MEDSFNMKPSELAKIEEAARLIQLALAEKENPSKLRLVLVEIQALRFEIGRLHVKYAGEARIAYKEAYWDNKTNKKMSPNASNKEAEADNKVVEAKNARDLFDSAKDTMASFVSTNQTSLGIAKEEAKNNL